MRARFPRSPPGLALPVILPRRDEAVTLKLVLGLLVSSEIHLPHPSVLVGARRGVGQRRGAAAPGWYRPTVLVSPGTLAAEP